MCSRGILRDVKNDFLAQLMDICRDMFIIINVCIFEMGKKKMRPIGFHSNELKSANRCQFSMVNDILMSSVFSLSDLFQ